MLGGHPAHPPPRVGGVENVGEAQLKLVIAQAEDVQPRSLILRDVPGVDEFQRVEIFLGERLVVIPLFPEKSDTGCTK